VSYPDIGGAGKFAGKWAMPIDSPPRTVSGTISLSDGTVLADATTGTNTQTLPPRASCYDAATKTGQVFTLKKVDASANAVVLKGDGADLIDDFNTVNLGLQYDVITVQAGPIQWRVLSTN